jgi:nicotinate-nucleotide pyrophosphorylase (carboxylating)
MEIGFERYDDWLSVGQAMVEAAHPSRILETRKTAPGLRLIDKWAVCLLFSILLLYC